MANDLDLKIRISAELADMKAAVAGLRKDFDNIGQSAKVSSKAATEGMNGVVDGIDEIIASLKREADLFGKTSQEVKLYDLALRGATQAEMAEAKAITNTISTLKNKAAAEQQAAAAEQTRQGSIKRVVTGLNEEVAALGKTSKELTLYKLQQLGATQAEIAHAKSLIEQKEAYERVNQSAGGLNGTLKTLAASAAAFFTIQGGIQLTQTIAQITSEYQMMSSKLKIATGEGEKFTQTQSALFQIAQNTSSAIGPLTDLYTNLARSTKNLNGVNNEQLLRLTEIIGKYRAIADMGPGADAALMQLGQALSSNFANASQEINSIIDQLPAVATALADSLGLDSAGQLKKFAEEGKLTSEIFVKAMLAMGDEADAQSAKIADTVSRAMTRLKNDVNNAVGQADMQPLIDAIDELRNNLNDPATQQGLQTFAAGLATISSWVVTLIGNFADFGRGLGFIAADIAGNVSEIDKLTNEIDGLQQALNGDVFHQGAGRHWFMSTDEMKEQIALLEKMRDAELVKQGGKPAAEQAKADAAAIEEKNRRLKEQAQAELELAQAMQEEEAVREKVQKDEKKRQESIQGIIDNLTEQAATEGKSAQAAVDYQLSQLGATEADKQRAAALSQSIQAVKDKAEADKEAKKRSEDAAKAAEKEAEARKKLLEDVARDTEQAQIELLRIEGKGAEARTREIEVRYREMMNRMIQAGDQNGQAVVQSLIDKQKVQVEFDDIQRKFDKLLADLKAKEGSLANRVRIGDLTQSEADAQLDSDRATFQRDGAGLVEQQAAIAEAHKKDMPELTANVNENTQALQDNRKAATGLVAAQGDLDAQMKSLKDGFAKSIANAGVDSLTNLFTDLIEGSKTASESIQDFAKSFAMAVVQLIARAAALQIALIALNAIPGGAAVAQLLGATASVKHTGGIVGAGGTIRSVNPAVFAAAPRYHTGGVAGLKPGEVPAILQKGEEVLTRNDPRHAANGGGQQQGGGTRVINVIDPNMVADYMSSSQGEQVLLNVLQRNSGSIKQTMMG